MTDDYFYQLGEGPAADTLPTTPAIIERINRLLRANYRLSACNATYREQVHVLQQRLSALEEGMQAVFTHPMEKVQAVLQ